MGNKNVLEIDFSVENYWIIREKCIKDRFKSKACDDYNLLWVSIVQLPRTKEGNFQWES